MSRRCQLPPSPPPPPLSPLRPLHPPTHPPTHRVRAGIYAAALLADKLLPQQGRVVQRHCREHSQSGGRNGDESRPSVRGQQARCLQTRRAGRGSRSKPQPRPVCTPAPAPHLWCRRPTQSARFAGPAPRLPAASWQPPPWRGCPAWQSARKGIQMRAVLEQRCRVPHRAQRAVHAGRRARWARAALQGLPLTPHHAVGDEAPSKGRRLLVIFERRPRVHVHREQVLLLQHRGAAVGALPPLQRVQAERVAGRGAPAPLHARLACGGGS